MTLHQYIACVKNIFMKEFFIFTNFATQREMHQNRLSLNNFPYLDSEILVSLFSVEREIYHPQ